VRPIMPRPPHPAENLPGARQLALTRLRIGVRR
jgi:hypothetical protein